MKGLYQDDILNFIMVHPPASLQPILWSVNVKHLDLEEDKGYIIPQVLVYGTLKEIRWLFQTYSKSAIANYFMNHPVKLYPKDTFLFTKNYLLGLEHKPLDADKYVTSFFGPVKQRTANRV